jgi:hypothetical protein
MAMLALMILMSGALLFIGTRLLYALIFGVIKARGVVRKRGVDRSFGSSVKREIYWFVFLLLPLSYAVLTFPSPRPQWLKYALMAAVLILCMALAAAIIRVSFWAFRERKRDADYIKAEVMKYLQSGKLK